MIAWPFIAFTLIFTALVCAHFFFAYRSWRKSRGQQYSDIDHGYVRLEDYFARSFRIKVSEWIKLPVQAALPGGIRIIQKGNERIRLSGTTEFPPNSQSEEILIVNGTFECGIGSVFNREIYVRQDAYVGAGCKLQSIAADGKLVLGSGVQVTRWADSATDLDIGINGFVGVRATAAKVMRLREGARVGAAVAPMMCTGHAGSEGAEENVEGPVPDLVLPLYAHVETAQGDPKSGGLDRQLLRRLSVNCYLYNGDLKPTAPLRVTTKLIVKGDCILPAGSVVEGDLKADGLIHIGARSVCRGSVIAGGGIWFAPYSRFSRVVHAGRGLWLSEGVRGGETAAPAAAYASEALWVECGVVVHGKLASGDRVAITGRARTA